MEIATEQSGASQESAPVVPNVFGDDTSAGTSTASPPSGGTPADENSELLKLLPADDGTEEIDYEGEKLKIPAKLKDAFLRQQDYTRKTQEVAETRRQIEAHAAALQRQAAFQQQNISEVASVVSIDRQLHNFSQLNWNKLIAEEPQRAMALDRQMRELQGQKAQLVQNLTQRQQQMALGQQQEIATRIQDGQRELERDIKGWSPDVQKKLVDYGNAEGFPPEVLSSVTEPAFVKMLHKAYLYDQLLAQRTAKPAAAPAPRPITRVSGGGATNTKANSDLSPEEWAAKRNELRYAKRR